MDEFLKKLLQATGSPALPPRDEARYISGVEDPALADHAFTRDLSSSLPDKKIPVELAQLDSALVDKKLQQRESDLLTLKELENQAQSSQAAYHEPYGFPMNGITEKGFHKIGGISEAMENDPNFRYKKLLEKLKK